jgi:hypothetical protein
LSIERQERARAVAIRLAIGPASKASRGAGTCLDGATRPASGAPRAPLPAL